MLIDREGGGGCSSYMEVGGRYRRASKIGSPFFKPWKYLFILKYINPPKFSDCRVLMTKLLLTEMGYILCIN